MTPPKIIYVPGVFDFLHHGHILLLWRARQLGDILIVGVVSDEGAAAYKERPMQDERARMAVVARLTFVDVVELQRTTDPTPQLERFRPTALVHAGWGRLLEGHETLERLGIEFIDLPYTPDVSSTALRDAARAADRVRMELGDGQ